MPDRANGYYEFLHWFQLKIRYCIVGGGEVEGVFAVIAGKEKEQKDPEKYDRSQHFWQAL